MTRAACIKLLVAVLVAFIICLPEFFPSDQAMTIDFPGFLLYSCMVNKDPVANITVMQQARDIRKEYFGGCANNSMYDTIPNRTGASIKCFLCQTKMDVQSVQNNASPSEAQQLSRCCNNCRTGVKATSGSCCILRVQGINATKCDSLLPRKRPSKASWYGGERLCWLVLILIVIALVVGSIMQEVHCRRKGYRGNAILPVSVNQPPELPVRYCKDENINAYKCSIKRPSLSPIHEHAEPDNVSPLLPGK
ncbi:hypothetical protein GJAV_G00066180 [Gymnothorax javanicus]|nr:hypothetical protein GJAV_G00066180 [Gymnothorax javanicus]